MSLHFSNKEDILTALESALTGISGMKRVDRQHFENFDNYDYPSAFINDIREMRRTVCLDVIHTTWSLVIVAFDMSEASDLSTKLNALIELVKAAVKADVTLGGEVYNTRITQIDTDEGFSFPHCVALFSIEVEYLAAV